MNLILYIHGKGGFAAESEHYKSFRQQTALERCYGRRIKDAWQNSNRLTVMENGEHWFHTEEQMKFLDEWILNQNCQ